MNADRAPAWRRYLRFWRPNPDADVADELRFHIESAIAEYVANGMSLDAARAEAVRRFGNVATITATLHTLSQERERTMAWNDRIGIVRDDVRFALRQLRKSPAFTMVATLTLALGIGANSAIFSIVDGVLLRPLPYAHADRLLSLRERFGPAGPSGMVVTMGNYATWTARAHSFEAIGAYHYDGFTLTGAGDPQPVQALRASASYWRALYIPPVIGHYYGAEYDKPGAPHVVIISHALWQSAFSSDSSIVGRSIMLSGVPYTVLGVAPAEYMAPGISAWTPLALTQAQAEEHSDHELTVIGLVRDGVEPEQAVAELTRVETELASQYPRSYFDGGIVATPLRDSIVGPARMLILMLFGAVALVLLIACVNIANLLLARAAARQKEIAVRTALGAARARIVGQLLTESLVMAGAGAFLGLIVAEAGMRFLVAHAPLSVPRLDQVRLDAPVVLFAFLLAAACGVGFGLMPALRASRLDLQQTLREGARNDSGTLRGYLRASLVVCQISMAMVLLIGAGLLVRSAVLMQRVAPGFDPHNLLIGWIGLPNAQYPNDTIALARFDQIAGAVSTIPGVASSALVSRPPIAGFGMDCNFRREGATEQDPRINANVRVATPGFFETMRIALLRGRSFTTGDIANAPRVAVINRRLGHELFGEADPIGRRVGCGRSEWMTVVGVNADVHATSLGDGVRDEVYLPLAQQVQRSMALVVRGGVPATTLASAIRGRIASLDPLLPLAGVRTMDDVIHDTLATPRFTSQLLSALGLLGLVLAVIGIYGVIAYFVSQRTAEIGVRMALGADRRRVVMMVVRQGLVMAVVGIVIGAVASYFLARAIDSMLYGVSARDPLTFTLVALLLGVVAILAAAIPARRAAKVDPVVALRAS